MAKRTKHEILESIKGGLLDDSVQRSKIEIEVLIDIRDVLNEIDGKLKAITYPRSHDGWKGPM